MFATGVSGILFQHHNGRPALGATAAGHPVSNGGCPTSFVFGKRTRPSHTFSKGPFGLTGVVFTPQGLNTLLNTHPRHLNDGSVQLNEFSRENIGEQLLNARSDRERVARLNDFLHEHIDGSGSEDALVAESLRLIQTRIRSIRVPQLLKCLNVSERQLERRFVRAIGVSPHQYIRIVRFQEAVRRIKANQFERLSDVAYDLNYVDQSHFIKDIKAFSGYTPTELVKTVQIGIGLPCALILARTDEPSTDSGDVLASPSATRDRNGRKKARISSTSNSGSSIAPKWPPLGIGVQRWTLKKRSAHSRGGWEISFGKIANPAGTSAEPVHCLKASTIHVTGPLFVKS
jgi:AraC-like DNA-binding protein